MVKKFQPEKVTKIFCPKCKDLMVKFYPWSSLTLVLAPGEKLPPCRKCQNELNKKASSLKPGVA